MTIPPSALPTREQIAEAISVAASAIVERDAALARCKALEETLEPFASADHSTPGEDVKDSALNVGAMFTYGDLRRARAALEAKDE